jgi:BirA family biotin operon repressor/biotin-[acetyl-CoA-carboxylase] ligase
MLDLAYKILRFPSLASTNDHCMQLLRSGKLNHNTVVVAEEQTAGKGQNSKKWHSFKGLNLMFSLYIQPANLIASNQFALNKTIALAVSKVISEVISFKAKIKWPNDILIEDKKVAGILIENQLSGNNINGSVIGVGVNVNQSQFGNEYGNATSLALETGQHIGRDMVLSRILTEIKEGLSLLTENKFEQISAPYDELLYQRHIECRFLTANGLLSGKIERVNKEGNLVVYSQNGPEIFRHGEIQFENK